MTYSALLQAAMAFNATYHAAVVAFTVIVACFWLETFCALRRGWRPAKQHKGARSFVKLSFFLSEHMFIHVAYVI